LSSFGVKICGRTGKQTDWQTRLWLCVHFSNVFKYSI